MKVQQCSDRKEWKKIYIFPKQRPAWWGSYFLCTYVGCCSGISGRRSPGSWLWLADSVAGRRGCGWELLAPVAGYGCGWGALVQMRCLWLGLECGFVYSLGSCRACLHNASRDCLHDMHRRMCASLCLHGCLHASLHGCHMITLDKGCIELTML